MDFDYQYNGFNSFVRLRQKDYIFTHADFYQVWGDVVYNVLRRELKKRNLPTLTFMAPVKISHRPCNEDYLSLLYQEMTLYPFQQHYEEVVRVTTLVLVLDRLFPFDADLTWQEAAENLCLTNLGNRSIEVTTIALQLNLVNNTLPPYFKFYLGRLRRLNLLEPTQLKTHEDDTLRLILFLTCLGTSLALSYLWRRT